MACEGADEPLGPQNHCLLGLTPRHASIMGEPIEDSFKPFARLVLPPIFQVMADKPSSADDNEASAGVSQVRHRTSLFLAPWRYSFLLSALCGNETHDHLPPRCLSLD